VTVGVVSVKRFNCTAAITGIEKARRSARTITNVLFWNSFCLKDLNIGSFIKI
jgi:hypothetical protein